MGNKVVKIVLTGGPCSGKTTVLRAIEEELGEVVEIVPEISTLILAGGFPLPGKDVAWSEEWQELFQSAILPVQNSFEKAFCLKAKANGKKVILCDRGTMDGAAYTPGGAEAFAQKYKLKVEDEYEKYDVIIHLESLSTFSPERYGQTGNQKRFEPLDRAQHLEKSVKNVWEKHPKHIFIDGHHGIAGKINQVMGIIRLLSV